MGGFIAAQFKENRYPTLEELDEASLVFDREDKLQTVPRVRTYGIVLASPLRGSISSR